ncbi:DNA double-strand break repair Rad50 ATPase, putative [Entamoeba invadens IP1]|uniref:DNA double-strand break repair Rad50 ATPase, putative n=1 Tax=Entamoeba invadens IP1 TaxID=370355 RepID=A0A0A1TVV3_ENTIV|nr:DNA double-strand break repair Rad50 ATPase, putative [Entamoeba invadens IP1]ELP84566.1 DNA double-strand break repair Rad50 ATPase, putative [Entamoeba invadens IP1]|eukprot:XP_004183912.1 DNA double-strand break repair Rad50 ATPase, putative [Entamoeba invadens IP1]
MSGMCPVLLEETCRVIINDIVVVLSKIFRMSQEDNMPQDVIKQIVGGIIKKIVSFSNNVSDVLSEYAEYPDVCEDITVSQKELKDLIQNFNESLVTLSTEQISEGISHLIFWARASGVKVANACWVVVNAFFEKLSSDKGLYETSTQMVIGAEKNNFSKFQKLVSEYATNVLKVTSDIKNLMKNKIIKMYETEVTKTVFLIENNAYDIFNANQAVKISDFNLDEFKAKSVEISQQVAKVDEWIDIAFLENKQMYSIYTTEYFSDAQFSINFKNNFATAFKSAVTDVEEMRKDVQTRNNKDFLTRGTSVIHLIKAATQMLMKEYSSNEEYNKRIFAERTSELLANAINTSKPTFSNPNDEEGKTVACLALNELQLQFKVIIKKCEYTTSDNDQLSSKNTVAGDKVKEITKIRSHTEDRLNEERYVCLLTDMASVMVQLKSLYIDNQMLDVSKIAKEILRTINAVLENFGENENENIYKQFVMLQQMYVAAIKEANLSIKDPKNETQQKVTVAKLEETLEFIRNLQSSIEKFVKETKEAKIQKEQQKVFSPPKKRKQKTHIKSEDGDDENSDAPIKNNEVEPPKTLEKSQDQKQEEKHQENQIQKEVQIEKSSANDKKSNEKLKLQKEEEKPTESKRVTPPSLSVPQFREISFQFDFFGVKKMVKAVPNTNGSKPQTRIKLVELPVMKIQWDDIIPFSVTMIHIEDKEMVIGTAEGVVMFLDVTSGMVVRPLLLVEGALSSIFYSSDYLYIVLSTFLLEIYKNGELLKKVDFSKIMKQLKGREVKGVRLVKEGFCINFDFEVDVLYFNGKWVVSRSVTWEINEYDAKEKTLTECEISLASISLDFEETRFQPLAKKYLELLKIFDDKNRGKKFMTLLESLPSKKVVEDSKKEVKKWMKL